MRRTRRDPRFLVPRPWEGMLRIPGDVVVEQHDAEQKELWVVSSEPMRREEAPDARSDAAGPEPDGARGREQAGMKDGIVRHRLRLAIVDSG